MARLSMAEKEKRKPEFLKKIFGSPKKRSEELSVKSGKANTAASGKMKAAESSFREAKASIRDKAKTKISDRSFKSTFDAASKAGKSTFTYGGKSYMTNKGKAENKDKMKTRIAPKGVFKKKSSLDADTIASFKKRMSLFRSKLNIKLCLTFVNF